MTRKQTSFIVLAVATLLASPAFLLADAEEDAKWEKKYQELLKNRPEIRKKVESGGATKEEVIAWMKKGGDRRKPKGGKKYYGAKITVKDPAEFHKAQEKVVYSGPQPGEKLPSFSAIGLRGKHKGEEYDPVAAAEKKPLVLIFQDNSVPGQKGLLLCGEALATVAKKSPTGLHVSTTFLVDDPTPNKVFEYDFMDEINEVVEMSVSVDRRDGPGAYGLDRNVAMTIMVAKEGKVLHNFALKQPMLYPDPYVFGAIADAIGVDRSTLAGWFTGNAAKRGVKPRSEKTTTDKTAAATESKESEDSNRGRREYDRSKLAVKDPAGFKTEGKQVFSGPQPGEKLPLLQATSLAGDNKGNEFDPIASEDDRPQMIIFEDESGVAIRGLYGIAKAIGKIDRLTDKDLHVVVVFLADDEEKINRFAGLFPKLLELGVDSVSLSQDGRDGPGAYGLDRTVSQTIILAKGRKVTRNFVFPQGMLYADPHVMGGIAELIGAKRETVAALLNQTAGENAATRRSDRRAGDVAARKRALRERLGALVEAGKITDEEAGELYFAAFPEDRRVRDREER